ncbi:MAG TPA: ABC transporter substrate-binding protein/permease [Nitrospirota bacterium]|nr:ABC transporter substrate-binding protein/permease [Nitrospirota bacterium]
MAKARFRYLLLSFPISLMLIFPGSVSASRSTTEVILSRGVLLWGCDVSGGAPLAFVDPKDPEKLLGFEVDIAQAIARELGVKAQVVQTDWDSLVPGLERGNYDIAMNGLEITPEREKRVLMSRPYYAYTLQLVVRKDEQRIRNVADLKGMSIGTMAGTSADALLKKIGGVDIRAYSQTWPFDDVALGRLDGALMDTPIIAYYAKPDQRLKYAGPPEEGGFYGIAMRKEDGDLKQVVDDVISRLLRSGELRRIYETWGLWDAAQARLSAGAPERDAADRLRTESADAPLRTFFPLLLQGAGITVLLSAASMALAIALGLLLAYARLSHGKTFSSAANAYIEVYRGTPLLIQLFILYYGLPNIGITLTPVAAAIIGLGMNYAAYEAEVYRAGIEAVPAGQMEAALSLGMPHTLALRRVVLPQALRISLPAMTNDFIALFKDSSIVSVIAMVELTKTYSILAATTLRYFELGLIVALLYFGMSYPLSLLAKRLEERLKGGR